MKKVSIIDPKHQQRGELVRQQRAGSAGGITRGWMRRAGGVGGGGGGVPAAVGTEPDRKELRHGCSLRPKALTNNHLNPVLPSRVCVQDQLGAAQGEVSRRRSLQAQQRDGGVLRPGSPAAFTPQRQLPPGQGLHHETGHQLPAHTQAARHR